MLALLLACAAVADEPLPAASAAEGISPAALEQAAAAARARGGDRFTVVVEAPYVVAGDEEAAWVRRRASGTIRWAHAALRADFFPLDPGEPVTVWLFRDDDSYERHVLEWKGEHPTTPYGFADDDGLFMNIGTGGGTLVHEMVHPLMHANFPDCPAWYNEALASLFEAVTDRGGRIWGFTNWRLTGLQASLAAGEVPPFAELMALDHDGFYGPRSGLWYAQGRYLLQHLQERGLLREYHRRFVASVADDPTGEQTLKAVLGVEDLSAYQAEWSAWVAGLSL